MKHYAENGFTLVELIMVITITGIIAGIVATFIQIPVRGYFDTAQRAELSDGADIALRRMTRDVRLALPNSIRISNDGNYVEFLQTRTGGRYLDEADDPAGNFLSFTDATDTSFDYIGPVLPIQPNDQMVVFNLGAGMAPADAYSGENRAVISAISGNTITLANNPFAVQSPAMSSPARRFFVVDTPVTYGCVNGTLFRYWAYPITAAQITPPSGSQRAMLATQAACRFDFSTLSHIRNQTLGLSLTLQSGDESVTLFHQVHVNNTP